ncbi:AGC family protein kinase [Trichomonas vaginalis G3]|uniref:AGC family protein kinase n=1 Tax=Trichomonas vaginalis (strain ATCC PRA-98 / G3) TaxID=412133 RepID=A2EI81_TRIV3|nr:protein serine/threonine kinase protein [Trichomonas vaginalis G3]EAY07641.1 AGC family protein kinase [Trichomonas vaginalis G3]KAI5500511.1 protein serine/threonine kinase protein [Trichomonas vaginalis G3]|eukprot:XP_001319864.1 AGC family protein kinase [Trichomonas vaginalis G3]
MQKVNQEIAILKQLDHPFLAPLYEFFQTDEDYYIVLEYLPGGTLHSLLSHIGKIQEWRARHYFVQLISALHYLHSEIHIIHCDIKLENILIDEYDNIRVVDFGLSHLLSEYNPDVTHGFGTISYCSQEMLRRKNYTITTDFWSAGVVLYAMITGHLPFKELSKEGLINSILNSEPEYDSSLSPDLVSLLNHLLAKNNVQRATHNAIVKSKWILQYPNAQYLTCELITSTEYSLRKKINQTVMKNLQSKGFNTQTILHAINSKDFSGISAPYFILAQKEMISKIYLTVFNRNFSLSTIQEKRPITYKNPSYQRFGSSTFSISLGSPTKNLHRSVGEKRLPLLSQVPKLTNSSPFSKKYL